MLLYIFPPFPRVLKYIFTHGALGEKERSYCVTRKTKLVLAVIKITSSYASTPLTTVFSSVLQRIFLLQKHFARS